MTNLDLDVCVILSAAIHHVGNTSEWTFTLSNIKATPTRLEANEVTSDFKTSEKNRGKPDSLKSVGPVVGT